jgi:hypothetical protein
MKKTHHWWIMGLLGIGLGYALYAWTRPVHFSEVSDQITAVLFCECAFQNVEVPLSETALGDLIKAKTDAMRQGKFDPTQAVLCGEKLLSILHTLPEDPTNLNNMQEALILQFYAHLALRQHRDLAKVAKAELEVALKTQQARNQVIAYYHRMNTLAYDGAEHLAPRYLMEAEKLAKKSLDKELLLLVNKKQKRRQPKK